MVSVLLPLKITTPPKRYETIGVCIFCNEPGKLTKEHLIPFGLAGNSLYMTKATCETCQKATHKFETDCLRHMWWPFRYRLGAPSQSGQKPKKFLLRRIRTTTKRPDGEYDLGYPSVEEVDPDRYPVSYLAMIFPEPGVLVGREPKTIIPQTVWSKSETLAASSLQRGHGIGMGAINPYSFAKLLAKIAHGYAKAELGEAFTPSLSNFVCGTSTPAICHWIGGDGEDAAMLPAPPMHTIRWRIAVSGTKPYVVVDLRLFAFVGAPQYHIVVGEFIGSLDQLPFLEQPVYTIDVEIPPPTGQTVPSGRRILTVSR